MQIQEDSPVLMGLEEFREHLGGRLTITLLTAVGSGLEVHEMDATMLIKAAEIVAGKLPL
jgi:3-dehydroquinate synthase